MNKFMLMTMMFLISAVADADAEEIKPRTIYATFAHKKMAEGVQGDGLSYGAGFKMGYVGMEIYQTDMRTIPKGMQRAILVSGTPTGKTVVSEKGFGIAYNGYIPIIRRLELFAGISTDFEKEEKVYQSNGGILSAAAGIGSGQFTDGVGTWRTRVGGQGGLMAYVPVGFGLNASVTAGYSSYRGWTWGVGIAM